MIDAIEVSKLDKLFDEIPLDDSGNLPVRDGIINIEKYNSAKFRVLWILKEVNDGKDGGNWDLREFLAESGFKDYPRWKTTFSIPLSVMHGLFNDFLDWEALPEVDDIDGDILESVAYINLKKIPGGARANATRVYASYQKSKVLILKQIDLFMPQIVIIAGNNMHMLIEDLGISHNDIKDDIDYIRYVKHNDVVFIDTYHPAQTTIKQQLHYESIIQACQKGLAL